MPTVGELNAKLTATDAGFKATLNTGAAQVDKLGGTVNANQGHFIKFNAHMLESRKVLGTFAALAGTSAGPLMHLAHAFGAFGVAGAAVLFSVETIRGAMERMDKDIKDAAESSKKFHDGWKNFNLQNVGAEFARLRTERLGLEEQVSAAGRFTSWQTAAETQQKRDRIEGIKTEERLLTEQYKNMQAKGGVHHVESAVKNAELGVFKLEHSEQSPQVVEQQKTNMTLAEIKQQLGVIIGKPSQTRGYQGAY